MRNLARLIIILALPLCAPSFGQTAGKVPPPDTGSAEPAIFIVAIKTPYRLTVKELRGAVAAFRKGRPTYAPGASLYFQVTSADGRPLDGLALTLRRGDKTIEVPIDANDRFSLPDLPDGDWTLAANRGRRSLVVKPVILSPGTDEADRLLGDMRLQCLVGWAIEKQHVSVFARGAFHAAGGCFGSKFAIYAHSARPIAGATVTAAGGTRPVQVLRDRHRFRPPLHDKTLPNSARVRFRFD